MFGNTLNLKVLKLSNNMTSTKEPGAFKGLKVIDWGLGNSPSHQKLTSPTKLLIAYVSLRLRVQNAVPAEPCVGKLEYLWFY